MQGGGNRVTNSGSIAVHGAASEGVFSNSVTGTFVTTIVNQAGASIVSDLFLAVRGINGQEVVQNAGTLSSISGTAIDLGNGTDTVVNTGTISGGNGIAINLGAANDTLTLGTGSSITGQSGYSSWTGSSTPVAILVASDLQNCH